MYNIIQNVSIKKCILHLDKVLYIFCIQFLAAIVFNFAYKIYKKVCRTVDEYILYTFYIHQLYIDLVQLLYTKCIHNFRVGHPFQKF